MVLFAHVGKHIDENTRLEQVIRANRTPDQAIRAEARGVHQQRVCFMVDTSSDSLRMVREQV